jgi:hypothetical protein
VAFLCYRRTTRWTARSGRPLVPHPLLFVDKAPYGSHQMRHGNVNPAFPENLCDPMHAESAAVSFQDLFLVLSQRVDLGLLPVTAAFGAAGDLKKILGSGFEIVRINQCESPHFLQAGGSQSLNLTTYSAHTERLSKANCKDVAGSGQAIRT